MQISTSSLFLGEIYNVHGKLNAKSTNIAKWYIINVPIPT